MKTKLPTFNFTFQNDQETLDIYIDGSIVDAETQAILQEWYGDDTSVSYKSLRNQVDGNSAATINFFINSGGGMVTDAMAIHDWIQELKGQGKTINTIGRGIVCSAATYILMAGNSSMSANSWFMIHNVSGATFGNVSDIENYAATLRKFNDSTRDFYCSYTGLSATVISNMMDAETWLTADEAKAKNFIKNVTPQVNFTNSISPDKWLFENKTVLAAYNSSTVKNDTDMVDKIIEGIKNALKEAGIMKVEGVENKALQPITNEALTAALTAALQPLGTDLDNMVNTAVTNGLKDHLAKINGIDEAITNATKGFVTTEVFNALEQKLKATEDELEATKQTIGNKVGGEATPPKNEAKSKFEHAGIGFSS